MGVNEAIAASTVQSGANKHSSNYALITDPILMKEKRTRAEKEEFEVIERMNDHWIRGENLLTLTMLNLLLKKHPI